MVLLWNYNNQNGGEGEITISIEKSSIKENPTIYQHLQSQIISKQGANPIQQEK
jgi:hypothetical protein